MFVSIAEAKKIYVPSIRFGVYGTFAENVRLKRRKPRHFERSKPNRNGAKSDRMGGMVDAARVMFDELGFDTLPLIPGAKNTYARTWQKRLSVRLWQNAPENANIGIRGGGLANVAFIDCDELRTFENVTNHLARLGFRGDSYPVIQTASGKGRHVYITLAGVLSGDARDLSKEIGAGEFRYGAGAYVVAPPSRISDGGGYLLVSGDYSIRPALEVKDILPILGNREIVNAPKPTIPRRATAMLKGKEDKPYSSRSHFDESLIASLINAGHSFESVLDLFENNQTSGKYDELKKTKGNKAALHYLSRSYDEAWQWTQSHESKARQTAKSAIAWAESSPWQGRTGAVDQLVYLAHANIAYKAGRLIYAASCRNLAELAGIGFKTALRSTYRLCDAGLLVPDKKAVADSANFYQLGKMDKVTHSLSYSVRKCVTLSTHDAFRVERRKIINKFHVYGLGKSAGQIWQALQERPATVDELADSTGRHVKTIERVIDRMSKLADPLTGEYLPMLASDDGETWRALDVDLDRIAQAVGTAGASERQRKQHARDRRLHARGLEQGRDKQGNHNQR